MRNLLVKRAVCLAGLPVFAQEAGPPRTMVRLGQIMLALGPEAKATGTAVKFSIEVIPVIVIADPVVDRMRVMRANFDSALDARYAVAQGRLCGAFIHPLSPLEQDQLISVLVQTVNLARTYGQAYSGGAQVRDLHAVGLTAGGSDEGAPRFWAGYGLHFFVDYLRDPQGNKIALYSDDLSEPSRDD